ncbi:MAG: hypothetical protein AAFY02_15575 [Pseudomonadota bacterium]
MTLGLERKIWTPLLILAALLAGLARMIVRTPGQVQVDGQLATGAYVGGVLGGALLPWVVGLVAAYGYWVVAKSRRSADYMETEFAPRQRLFMHRIVGFLILLMLLEALGVAALRLGVL